MNITKANYFNNPDHTYRAEEVLCLKRQFFSLAFCLVLCLSLFSVSINLVKSASGDGIVEVELNVRGTFLRAMDDFPYFGPSDGHIYDEELEVNVLTHTDFRVEEATVIDLQAEGFVEGDKMYISWLGGFYPDGAWNPDNPGSIGYGLKENDAVSHGGLLGLFSTTSQVLDIDTLNRVPGAIDYGDDYSTPATWWKDGRAELAVKLAAKGVDWYTGSMETDIPEDFKISPYTGMKVEVPRNARFLFLSLIDPYYRDNYEGPNGLVVTIEKDTDEDGLPDHWELNGIDIDKDGETDLDLPMLGADWEHKDIFVEIDHMSRPVMDEKSFDAVVNAFDNAPVSNPDGSTGINLHLILDEYLPAIDVLSGMTEFYMLKSNYFGSAEERLNSKTIEAKKMVFRYCLVVNKLWIDGCPGISEGKACDDFIIARNADQRTARWSQEIIEFESAVFMHELGHSLGLGHGGGDDVNYKPNYLSIMNYRFQYNFLLSSRPLDYSRKELLTLDENLLDEARGIGEATKTAWWTPSGYVVSDGSLAIDWNLDGNITSGVSQELNYDERLRSQGMNWYAEQLRGYDDWSNLVYRFRGFPLALRSATSEDYHIELTIEEILAMEEEAKNIVEVFVPESYVPSSEVVSFGLKEGDWFEYSVTWTGGEPESYYAVRFKGEVLSVTDETIEIQWESENVAGKTGTYTEIYDVNLGGHTIDVIPANLQIGATIFSEDLGVIDIDGEEDYDYAGSTRHVLWAVEDFGTVHWDEETGLLVQSDSEVGELHRKMLLEKTNAWEHETAGLDLILVAALGIIIVAILLILIIFFRRKKKKEKQV